MPSKSHSAGFTLVELLVGIAIIAILASLLLPALSSAKSKAYQAQCTSNHRQLALAWTLYANDHGGKIVPDRMVGTQFGATPAWVRGTIHGNSPGFNDPMYLTHPAYASFAPYFKNWRSYKCPAERVFFKVGRKQVEKTRSYSMSSTFLTPPGLVPLNPQVRAYNRTDSIINPSSTFVFIDVEPASICWEQFRVPDRDSDPWWHSPGALHNRGALLSFADNHTEFHRWRTPNNRAMSIADNLDEHPVAPPRDSLDVSWLRRRSHHAVVP